jgi:hypothetical protein
MNQFNNTVSIHDAILDVRGLVHMQFQQGIGGNVAYPILIGNPGIAKTALCVQYFSNDTNLIISDFPHLPLEEVGGMPIIEDLEMNGNHYKKTSWTIPSLLSEIYESIKIRPTVLFFDEVDKCDQSHQDLLVSILNGKLRGYNLPKQNFAIIMAGNGSSRAGSKILSSILTNRSAMIPVHMDFKYWKQNFAIPNEINNKVVSFLSNDRYLKYFSMEEMVNRPWASPRSWTRLATFLSLKEQFMGQLNFQQILSTVESFVGQEAASDFAAYYKLYTETEMDKVFEKKKEIHIPTDYTEQYTYILAAVSEFFNKLSSEDKDKDNNNVFDIMANIIVGIANKSSEISITGMREIVTIDSYSKKRRKLPIYSELRRRISSLNKEVEQKITRDIELL